MADKQAAMEAFVAKVEADGDLRAKLEAARDASAIASIAVEQGLELEESDFELVEETELDDADLEGVTGGMKIVVVVSGKGYPAILTKPWQIKKPAAN